MIKKSQLQLVFSNNSILHTPPEKFDFAGDIDAELFSNVMHEKMEALGGVGLSANQVGLNIRMFVLGAGDIKMTVFNPEIIETSKEEVSLDEGCLSFPGLYMKVSRPVSCKVRFQNIKNETVEQELTGLTARIFLHEYDHMMGKTFRSRVSQLKWDMANKKKQKKTKKIVQRKTQALFKQIREDIKNGDNSQRVSQ